MGYTTEFQGSFNIDKALDTNLKDYLDKFLRTRHMKRDVTKLSDDDRTKSIHNTIGLPIGDDCEFFISHDDEFGDAHTPDVIDYNKPPKDVPGLWSGWVLNDSGTEIEWDGGEKFYNYVEWLKYIIEKFLQPKGYTCNGKMKWRGESFNDMGVIEVINNVVTTREIQ